MDCRSFGKKVRSFRKARRLTQEALAEMADISASFLGHIERGTRTASMDTLIALCNALNVSPQILLSADLISFDNEHIVAAEINHKEKLIHLLDLAVSIITEEK